MNDWMQHAHNTGVRDRADDLTFSGPTRYWGGFTNPSDTMNSQNITSIKSREMSSAKCQPFCFSLNVLTPSCSCIYVICFAGPVTARRHACWPGVRCCIEHEYCAVQRELVCHVRYHTCAVPVHRSMPSTSHLITDHHISVNALLAVNPVMRERLTCFTRMCVLHLDLHHSIVMWLATHLISPANTLLGLLIVEHWYTGRRHDCWPVVQLNHMGHLDIKMASYQYRISYYKDKTVWRPSYLCNGNPYIWKWGLRIETVLWFFTQRNQ